MSCKGFYCITKTELNPPGLCIYVACKSRKGGQFLVCHKHYFFWDFKIIFSVSFFSLWTIIKTWLNTCYLIKGNQFLAKISNIIFKIFGLFSGLFFRFKISNIKILFFYYYNCLHKNLRLVSYFKIIFFFPSWTLNILTKKFSQNNLIQ